jgi:DNA-binding transcriptional LysR family regulator
MLTEAGEALLQPAEQVEAQLLSLERGAAMPGDNLAGIVRLAVPEFLGQHLIIPGLTEFQKRFPMIGLELIADVRPMRLTRREADVLVRLVHPNQGSYLVRRIGGIVLALYGSTSYLAAHGIPRRGDELSGHRLIGWESGLKFLPLAQWLQNMAAATNFVIRAHTMGAQLAAVEAGLGPAGLRGAKIRPCSCPGRGTPFAVGHLAASGSRRTQAGPCSFRCGPRVGCN